MKLGSFVGAVNFSHCRLFISVKEATVHVVSSLNLGIPPCCNLAGWVWPTIITHTATQQASEDKIISLPAEKAYAYHINSDSTPYCTCYNNMLTITCRTCIYYTFASIALTSRSGTSSIPTIMSDTGVLQR